MAAARIIEEVRTMVRSIPGPIIDRAEYPIAVTGINGEMRRDIVVTDRNGASMSGITVVSERGWIQVRVLAAARAGIQACPSSDLSATGLLRLS
jgi:hypothetical protein